MLLFFCPSVTWLAFYICNTQKLGLLFKREREREREGMSNGRVPLQSYINQGSGSSSSLANGNSTEMWSSCYLRNQKTPPAKLSSAGTSYYWQSRKQKEMQALFLLLLLFRIWRYVRCGICKLVEYKSWIQFLPKQIHCVQDKANYWEAQQQSWMKNMKVTIFKMWYLFVLGKYP